MKNNIKLDIAICQQHAKSVLQVSRFKILKKTYKPRDGGVKCLHPIERLMCSRDVAQREKERSEMQVRA